MRPCVHHFKLLPRGLSYNRPWLVFVKHLKKRRQELTVQDVRLEAVVRLGCKNEETAVLPTKRHSPPSDIESDFMRRSLSDCSNDVGDSLKGFSKGESAWSIPS